MKDLIIIGAGPAGLSACLYATRAGAEVLMLDAGAPGGKLNVSAEIENWPGQKKKTGPELAYEMYEHALSFGGEQAYGEVTKVIDYGDYKEVITTDQSYEAKNVLIATGTKERKMGIPMEEELTGHGVSYCAVCDAAFFKDEDVVVVGGGDSAIEEGIYLSQMAKSVTVIHRRDQLRAQKVLQDRAFANEKIDFLWNSVVEEFVGDGSKITGVRVKDVNTGEVTTHEADGVFIYVGLLPVSDPFKDLNITDAEGWIVTNEQMETSIPGIFAVGDVRQKTLRQITTAVGDGGQAGHMVYNYVEEIKEKLAK